MKLKDYDYNIYVADGEISLSAYRLCHEEHKGVKHLTTDTANYTSLRLPMTEEYHEEITYLLSLEDWQDIPAEDLEEFDDWVGLDYLTRDDTPAIIKSFLDHLPEYEIE